MLSTGGADTRLYNLLFESLDVQRNNAYKSAKREFFQSTLKSFDHRVGATVHIAPGRQQALVCPPLNGEALAIAPHPSCMRWPPAIAGPSNHAARDPRMDTDQMSDRDESGRALPHTPYSPCSLGVLTTLSQNAARATARPHAERSCGIVMMPDLRSHCAPSLDSTQITELPHKELLHRREVICVCSP